MNYIALVVFLTLFWPVIQILLFAIRFGRVDTILAESIVFAPLGLVSGLVFVWFLKRAQTRREKIGVGVGYFVATPFALIASILGGLMLPPAIGATIYGLIPLCVGMFAAELIAKHSRKPLSPSTKPS